MVEFGAVMLVILLFIVGLTYGARLVDRILPERERDPETLLARRFAVGEIDETEYARRLAILRYGPPRELLE